MSDEFSKLSDTEKLVEILDDAFFLLVFEQCEYYFPNIYKLGPATGEFKDKLDFINNKCKELGYDRKKVCYGVKNAENN